MNDLSAKHVRRKTPTEVRNVSVSFKGKLDSGETLSGSPSVSVSPSGPTLGTPAKNSGTITVDDESCAANEAVQFTVSGGTASTTYTLTVQCGTSASQTVQVLCKLKVADG